MIRWDEECKQKAMELTKEKRQEFLDLMWNGKTIKEAYTICKISFDEANGIMMLNLKDITMLNTKTV